MKIRVIKDDTHKSRNTGHVSRKSLYFFYTEQVLLHVTFSPTLENIEKVGYLLELNGAKERLKIMRADLVEEGSFDAAVEGVDGVFHVASPVLVAYDDNVKASAHKIYISVFHRDVGNNLKISPCSHQMFYHKKYYLF